MKIAIIGYGKMGKALEKSALVQNIEVSQIISSTEQLAKSNFTNDEVAIDFTNSKAFMENICILSQKNIPIITGTTGWYDNLNEVKKIIENNNSTFLYSSNFSIGIYAFWQAIQALATLFNQHEEYDVMMHEWHNASKKDAPSGTALATAKIILEKIKRKSEIVTDLSQGTIQKQQLQISSIRGGDACNHEVIFDSPVDTLRISHQAKSRDTFAAGALKCAIWLQKKPKGFYTIHDYLAQL